MKTLEDTEFAAHRFAPRERHRPERYAGITRMAQPEARGTHSAEWFMAGMLAGWLLALALKYGG